MTQVIDRMFRAAGARRAAVAAGLGLLAAGCASTAGLEPLAGEPEWALAVHGGAGVISREKMTPEREAAMRASLAAAARAGEAILSAGGSSLDAVEAAIRVLEDDPAFNAGRGAVFTAAGRNELDASIMSGADRDAGAVAGVTTAKNPISLARAVMERSPHVMMAGDGADAFAAEQGLERVDNSYFATPERRRQLDERLARQAAAPVASAQEPGNWRYGTVGAVARDASGALAAGTSTGGMTAKLYGRVGDSPIIGAGTYADDRACAVSATGWGEYFIRVGVAKAICDRALLTGQDVQSAADAVMADVGALGGDGGVIVLAPQGAPVYAFNSEGMYRARVTANSALETGVYGLEDAQPAP